MNKQPVLSTLAVAFALAVGAMVAPTARASSHRDAPLISEDPAADNTDVYAFVSTELGRSDYVTIIANYIPLQEPANGPNFYKLSDYVIYEINIDVDGDGRADLTYRFQFTSRIVDQGTYLYNTNTILPPLNPADPTSQYVNLNQTQSYTLTEFGKGAPKNGRVLLQNVRAAPYRPGPKSINILPLGRLGTPVQGDTSLAYQNLAQMAVHTASNAGGLRAFVGPRDEGFFVNLGTAFDLINPIVPGADGTSGFNVSTLAIEIPKARLRAAGDTDGIIGVWATATRTKYPVCDSKSNPNQPCVVAGEKVGGDGTQVSRLSNPLFNEFLNPIKVKDLYNATTPLQDAANVYPFILNPGTAQGPNTLTQQLKEFIHCTDTVNRRDQVASWMLGYPAGVVNGFPGNRETQTATPVIADMMRLNYNIAPSAVPNPLGVLAGDFAGMPNGRRVGDDAVDILLKLWGGAIQDKFGGTPCPLALALTDAVATNDTLFLPQFPYLGLPHEGFSHTHVHSQP